uniref:Uncharacterized protein n=1 Tax=Salmo trutta TaxID=8032 RepID=A0A673ZNT2_SALTR
MYGESKMDWPDQEHNEEMDWITSRNLNFCIWRERKDDEDSL